MGEMNLPWSIYTSYTNPDNWPGIEARGESIVVWGSACDHDDYAGVRGRTVEEARERAALIVRAVNRDALFNEAVEALEQIEDGLPGTRAVHRISEFRQIARAILSKIKAAQSSEDK